MSAPQIQLRFQQTEASGALADQLLERIDVARIQLPGRTQDDPRTSGGL